MTIAIAIQTEAMIAKGFKLNSSSFLTSGPDFIINRASRKNFIPLSNTPDEIENCRQRQKRCISKSADEQRPRTPFCVCPLPT